MKKFVGQEVMKKESAHGGEVMEGVYVRIEEGGWVKDRFKMRRKTFTAGREGFTTHIKNNALIGSSSPAPKEEKKEVPVAVSGKAKGSATKRGGKK